MNHTDGPWIFGPNANLHADTSLKECLRVCNPRTNKTTAITWNESDARLIAAAPDLLAALKAMHACHRAFSNAENWTALDDDARAAAESAINKATGE
jgi:hypothetical protein